MTICLWNLTPFAPMNPSGAKASTAGSNRRQICTDPTMVR
eukprot:CAMPEP_0173202946 /NCGR_PEP_ID=MMETSP1141-20130122/19254_1 /TAXON_ID=483371 /ORGANISM="non described non described, Strain CCMP2298" /LENGTH=39 /DNA_ID= /DNA_START= /DNA_END= /DNA_ORIENTATION=